MENRTSGLRANLENSTWTKMETMLDEMIHHLRKQRRRRIRGRARSPPRRRRPTENQVSSTVALPSLHTQLAPSSSQTRTSSHSSQTRTLSHSSQSRTALPSSQASSVSAQVSSRSRATPSSCLASSRADTISRQASSSAAINSHQGVTRLTGSFNSQVSSQPRATFLSSQTPRTDSLSSSQRTKPSREEILSFQTTANQCEVSRNQGHSHAGRMIDLSLVNGEDAKGKSGALSVGISGDSSKREMHSDSSIYIIDEENKSPSGPSVAPASEGRSRSYKRDKIEKQNQNNSSAGLDSLSYDQGYYSEHLLVANIDAAEKRLLSSPVTVEDLEVQGCSRVDNKPSFGVGVIYWNPPESSGTSLLRPLSLHSDDSPWAWRVADKNRVADDRVALVSSYSTSFCPSFDPFGSETHGYAMSGSKVHTGNDAQSSIVTSIDILGREKNVAASLSNVSVDDSRRQRVPTVHAGSSSFKPGGMKGCLHDGVNFEEAGIHLEGNDVVWPPWRIKSVSGHQVTHPLTGALVQDHLIATYQTIHEQEHPDTSIPLQPFEMLKSPLENGSLGLIHINPHEEVNTFYQQFDGCDISSEVKITCPVLSLGLAIVSEVKSLKSISTSAATTALDSSTNSLSVAIGNESGSEKTRLQLITEPNTEVSLLPSGAGYQCKALSSLVSSPVCNWQDMASGSQWVMGFESRQVAVLDIGSPSVLFLMYSPSSSRSLVFSAKASLGVHQNTVKPEGGISYETKEELALCLPKDGHIILITSSIGSLIHSQPVHPENDVERKDQTAPSDHEEQNTYKDPNNQSVLQASKLMVPPSVRYWEGRGARRKMKWKIKAVSDHPP